MRMGALYLLEDATFKTEGKTGLVQERRAPDSLSEVKRDERVKDPIIFGIRQADVPSARGGCWYRLQILPTNLYVPSHRRDRS